LCWINPCLCEQKGLIQRAVDSYRNTLATSKSRRVVRKEKLDSGTLRRRIPTEESDGQLPTSMIATSMIANVSGSSPLLTRIEFSPPPTQKIPVFHVPAPADIMSFPSLERHQNDQFDILQPSRLFLSCEWDQEEIKTIGPDLHDQFDLSKNSRPFPSLDWGRGEMMGARHDPSAQIDISLRANPFSSLDWGRGDVKRLQNDPPHPIGLGSIFSPLEWGTVEKRKTPHHYHPIAQSVFKTLVFETISQSNTEKHCMKCYLLTF
jgi:hypothetical protein